MGDESRWGPVRPARFISCRYGSRPTSFFFTHSLNKQHDAIFVKRNNFNLLLHETFGGGFSPTAVLKLRRLAKYRARQR